MSVSHDRSVAVVVPARNEVATVRAVVRAVLRDLHDAEVIVVDDQSEDRTSTEARESGATVISTSAERCGLGAAFATGTKFAVEQGYPLIMTIDADGQYHSGDLRKLLAVYRVRGSDLVVGNRFGAGRPEAMTRSRYAANRAFSALFAGSVSGLPSVDAQSGLRLFTADVARRCAVTNSYTHTQEQLLRAGRLGLKIHCESVRFGPRLHGSSRLVDSTTSYARKTVPSLIRVNQQLIRSDCSAMACTDPSVGLFDHSH